MVELEGQIEDFIYQNESNSYSIAVFQPKYQIDPLTIVGYLPFIAVRRYNKDYGKNGCSPRIR